MAQPPSGIPGKGGAATPPTTQQIFSEEPGANFDIDTGSGYFRNPYASGFGMGYQSPMMATPYLPRYGMLGPSGFGAYGGYSPYDTYNPYASASPYGGGKGGYMPQPVYRPYGGKGGAQLPPFDTYGANMAGATAADQGSPAGVEPPVTPPVAPPAPPVAPPVVPPVVPPVTPPADPFAGAGLMDRLTMIERGIIPPDITQMDASNVDFNSTTLQGAAIAEDGSNVVDFTPYTGDEFVRIGDQVVSRAELQRRGSDYYTKPVTPPGGRLAGPGTGLDPSIDQVMRDQVIVDPAEQDYIAGPMPPEQDYVAGPLPPSMLGFVPTPYPYSTMMPKQVYGRRQMPSGKGGY